MNIDIHALISIFHIVVIVPLFAYVFYMKAGTPDFLCYILLALGVIVFIFHLYKSFIKYLASSPTIWVNIVHVLFIAPLLIYIGYNGKKTPRAAYEILGLEMFAALGYHLYSLAINLHNTI